MKEKERPTKLKPAGNGGDDIFNVEPEPEPKNVSVSSGPYLEELPVAGRSVGEIRRKFKDRFDIDDASQAIINGQDADEDQVLKAGEALMFVRHAGEKGSVTIQGTTATATTEEQKSKSMALSTLVSRMLPGIDTGPCILPTGVRAVLSRGHATIMVWERPPGLQKLSWIRHDSPRPYGHGTTYRNVRIALPYLVIFAAFTHQNGMPVIARTDECFFRTEPLTTLDDELCFPALLNCSKFADPGKEGDHHPLSWICTQYLQGTKGMNSKDKGVRYAAGFEAVRYCLLETSFNLSSEHHEGNSWFGASKAIDKRISTVENWEEASAKDPLFVLDVPWIKTNHSVKDVAERMFTRLGVPEQTVKSSQDLARIIING